MSLKMVTKEHIDNLKKRYGRVLDEMEDKRKEEVVRECKYPELLKRLKTLTNHSELYLAYVLNRRFDTLNLFTLLDDLKGDQINELALRNMLEAWESFSAREAMFGADDVLDLPFRFLDHVMDANYECSKCSTQHSILSVLREDKFACSCGHTPKRLYDASGSREDILPSGYRYKVKKSIKSRKKVVL